MSGIESTEFAPEGVFSIEVVPPGRGAGLEDLLAAVEAILPYGPSKVSVTDHPAGPPDGAPLPGGGFARSGPRSKPGTLGTALALQTAFRVRAVPHLVARGADRYAMEDLLIDLHYAGFRELFVVRGDDRFYRDADGAYPPARDRNSSARDRTYSCAADLVAHAAALNRGEYLPPSEPGKPTAFRVGVAGYPEKHFASPNKDADLRRLREKVEAGASYIVTQMVFDTRPYLEFVTALRGTGIDVPVIPGIKPLTRASQAAAVPRNFFVDVPDGLLRALEEARTPEEERRTGIRAAARLAEDLLSGGAPALHFFTMGRGGAARDVLDAVFGGPGGVRLGGTNSEGSSR